ncbi:cell surface protein [Lactiplantibacillus pingfangensis]|uniref:cell surface protein n=1 Tax=Lactiplantibacillus pingfangensis TaxID=2559915 RepID=UPI0010F565E2|nr:cell surface protein [Lactiplantibacillus pingfangensis]
MGNLKNWKKVLSLVITSTLLGSWMVPLKSLADDTMLPVAFNPGTVTGDSMYGESYATLDSAPTITSITANNVENGNVTNRTTMLSVTWSGSIVTKAKNNYKIKDMYTSVFNSSNTLASSKLGTNLIPGTQVSSLAFNSSNAVQTAYIDWSMWNGSSPLKVGLKYVPYYAGYSAENESARSFATIYAIQRHELKPTITNKLAQGTTVIEGKGTIAGDKITVDADPSVSTTVNDDLSYSLSLSGTLSGKKNVTITEGNDAGDSGTATADVEQRSLNITSSKTTADTYPDDLSGLSSDSDVIAWLVKTTGISSSYSDSSSTDGVTYASDTTGLAASLKALADGATMTIPVYAKDDSGLKSDPVTITVTNHAGVLQFGAISSDIGFGSLEIPTAETVFQPTAAWNVNVSDTRAAGSNWSVYATATPLKSATHTLAGNLIYKDGSTQTVLTNSSTLIDSGTKVAGTTNTQITSDWSATKGIMLDVQPSVYADSYSGSVDWSLQNTPTN